MSVHFIGDTLGRKGCWEQDRKGEDLGEIDQGRKSCNELDGDGGIGNFVFHGRIDIRQKDLGG